MLRHVLAKINPLAGESTSQTHYNPITSPSDETQPRRSRSGHSRRNSTLSLHVTEDSGIKLAHYILGAASLLPWNAMITAMPYFLARLEGSSFQSAFPSYLSSIFNLAGFAALSYATATAKQANTSKRIRPSLTVITVSLFTLAVSPFTSWSPGLFFAFVLLNALFQASFGAYFQAALVRLASLFGPYAIQAFFTGQAAVGVAVSAVQFVAAALAGERRSPNEGTTPSEDLASLDDEKDRTLREASTSAFYFFSLSTAFLVFTHFLYLWLTKLPTYHEVVHPHLEPSTAVEENEEAEVEEAAEDDGTDDEGAHPMSGSMTESGHLLAVHVESQVRDADVSVLGVAKINALYNFAVGYVFIVTLAIFPPITASIRSTNPIPPSNNGRFSIFSPILFTSLHFLVFNIGDYIGRASCSNPRLLISSGRRLLTLSLLRTIFIPLFLACNVQRPSATPSAASPPLINSDLLFFLILLVFGMSNGFVGTMCMISASSPLHNHRLKKEQVEIAATLAQFSLVGGLAVGSVFSFGVKAAVCQCNPFIG
ncbi:hypothetical protein FRC04_003970 [Tulasnella sp. 424]|nr:hypothetical protein FRC04_003970 [Tulasnella sp. 424]